MNSIKEIVASIIKKRRSTRHFTEAPISESILLQLIEIGICAPSGSNWQNQRFLVIEEADEIMRIGRARFVWPYKGANHEKIRQLHPGGIIGEAAAIIIVFSNSLDNDRRGNGEFYIWEALEIQNCSASIENILIMATAMGIGSCWISASDKMNHTRMFSGQSWRGLLADYEIPNYYKLQGIVILGYPIATDEEGFPAGEKKHGATIWQSTERQSVGHYLIKKRNGTTLSEIRISTPDRMKALALAKLLCFLQKVSLWCDKKIHRIEVEKYLRP